MQSYIPTILGCTLSRLSNGRAKHVNKKNAGNPLLLGIKSECTEKSSKPWPQFKT